MFIYSLFLFTVSLHLTLLLELIPNSSVSDVMEVVMRERARFDRRFGVEGSARLKKTKEEEVNEEWWRNAVEVILLMMGGMELKGRLPPHK